MTQYKLDLNMKDLKENEPKGATVQGKRLAVLMHNGKVYALNAVCTHEGGPLDEGYVEKDELICPWHAGAYDIATGKADENTNWVHDTETYKISVDNASGELSVEI